MAKTLETLTEDERVIIQEFIDAFGMSEQEALETAIAEGAISENGGGVSWHPEDYLELRYYEGHTKSNQYLINRQLKKEKKAELFNTESFYLGTTFEKNEDGSYKLDSVKTFDCGETPEILVLGTYFKATRNAFNAGKPLPTNFSSTLAPDISKANQAKMIAIGGGTGVEGKSVLAIREALTKEYGEASKAPETHKVKFRTVIFGLVRVENEWKKFYFEVARQFNDTDSIEYNYNTDLKGQAIKSQFKCKLERTGTGDSGNAIIQIVVGEKLSPAEFQDAKDTINDARSKMLVWVKDSQAQAEAGSSPKTVVKEAVEEEEDPFN